MRKIQPQKILGTETWQCPKCKAWRPAADFYKDNRTPNGLKSHCKMCHSESCMRTRNPDNTRRINREYMRRTRWERLE